MHRPRSTGTRDTVYHPVGGLLTFPVWGNGLSYAASASSISSQVAATIWPSSL
jgi:hypothetical protein